VKWRVKIGAYMPVSVVATGEAVYVGAKDLRAYDSDGKLLWKRGGGGVDINGLALGPDGTIYVGDVVGHVHALDSNGTEKWRRTVAVGRQAHASRPAVARDGTVYVASSRGNLHAFAPDGREKWIFDGGSRRAESPVVAPNGDICFSVEEAGGGRLFAVGPDGKRRWSRKCDDIVADPAVAADGTIYFCEFAGLRALDPRGQIKWTFPGRGGLSDPLPGRAGVVYVSSSSGKLLALNDRGKKLWEYRTDSLSGSVDGVGSNGVVYASTSDTLFALEVK
jgi:outer membrane protein assembly factor BamB